MKLIKMKFRLALIFICNITSLQGQLDEGLPFYNTFNDQLLNAKLSFADSKKDVENIYDTISKKCSRIEYFEIRNKNNLSKNINKKNFKIFISYYFGNVRLIDNF